MEHHLNKSDHYNTYKRSLLDSGNTEATMTLNSFEKGGDGGGPSECDSNRGCGDNIVDASYAVWVALQVSESDWGQTAITWSDA
ncbi:putative ripening-related protein 1 [Tanacetum coccineum]